MEGEQKLLYCVGCGRAVCEFKPGRHLAISCTCGASAPILYTKDGKQWLPPSSLVRATGVRLSHLEYYLGFSYHQSEVKTIVTRMLRALNSFSYTECPDERCRESFERSRQAYLKRRGEESRGN